MWPGASRPRTRAVVGVALLAGTATVVFASAAQLPFLADDYGYLHDVQVAGWWHSGPTWDLGRHLFRPVLFLWFGLLHGLFGLHPLPFHIASGLLVLAAAVLTGMVAHRVGLRSGAFAAAAFFGLHAAMAIPIGWAAATNSPLAVVLALSALHLMLRTRLRAIDVVAACALFAVALMTREVVAITPVVLVMTRYLVEPAVSGFARLRRTLLVSSPLWLVLVAYGTVRSIAGLESATEGPYAQSLGTHAVGNLTRLAQMATNLEALRSSPGYVVLVAVFWVGLVALCVSASWRTRRPVGLVGLAWSVVGVLPVVFLANQNMSYYYVDYALAGLAIAVGAAFEWLADLVSDRLRITFAAGSLVLLAILSYASARAVTDDQLEGWARRTERIIEQVERDHPDPPAGSTIVVRYGGRRPPRYLTHNGALFHVLWHDPTLQVRYVRR